MLICKELWFVRMSVSRVVLMLHRLVVSGLVMGREREREREREDVDFVVPSLPSFLFVRSKLKLQEYSIISNLLARTFEPPIQVWVTPACACCCCRMSPLFLRLSPPPPHPPYPTICFQSNILPHFCPHNFE